MIVKDIVQIGNPIISRKSAPVVDVRSRDTKKIIKDLVDSMRHYNLVGMAAPQIGKNLNIFVTEIRKTKNRKNLQNDKLRIFINPKITWSSKKEVIIYEGCGSVAYSKLFAPVRRPEKIVVKAFDENGDRFELEASGLLARVIQHEYDHLRGITFIEKVTDMRQAMSAEEYRKRKAKKK
jgi:peptide deformylase